MNRAERTLAWQNLVGLHPAAGAARGPSPEGKQRCLVHGRNAILGSGLAGSVLRAVPARVAFRLDGWWGARAGGSST
jgi:hypothetical protein